MSFSDLVQAKLDARRRGEAPIQATAATLRQQALERIKPIYNAVETLVTYMSKDALFAAVFDAFPKVEFQWEATFPMISTIQVDGKAGFFHINVQQREAFGREAWSELRLRVVPDLEIMAIIGGGRSYASANEIKADARDISGFLLMVEDTIAELLADIAISPAGGKYLKGCSDRS